MTDSRIGGLHALSVMQRIDELGRRGFLSAGDAELLRQGRHVLLPAAADSMIENVVGTFSLPLAIAPNFIVNGRDYIVPMVIEEPSVVAALSRAAKQARPDGFVTTCRESLLAGQVYVTGIRDAKRAAAALLAARRELVDAANTLQQRLRERGGGTRDIEVRSITLPDRSTAIAVDILVDTCDAMGANLVNTLCESLAPRIGEICGGDVALRILSNLADRSVVKARVNYLLGGLATGGYAAERVRDRIIMASNIACADPYRAATHNKGIMNGVDALAIATGNDWRAIEAGAHAFAARSGRYQPLARWSAGDNGDLVGELEMPLRVATVGGTLHVNPAATLALRMTGVESAGELADLMAAVGLAQNFAAIRALATRGIQEGHMRLQARSRAVKTDPPALTKPMGAAAGKVILLGEHAVVYGRSALALPIPHAVTASVRPGTEVDPFHAGILDVLRQMAGIDVRNVSVAVRCGLPRGMGLGSSAAIAVAITRACSRHFDLKLDDDAVNRIAFAAEKLAHGTPSGIDNTIATFGVPMLFRNEGALHAEELRLDEAPPLVIAFSSERGSTNEQVSAVRRRYDRNPEHFAALFDEIDALSMAGAVALRAGKYEELGSLMNICHGLLNAIEVSTPEIESMIGLARSAGASGAKLTGSGGGGAIVAMCPGRAAEVSRTLNAAGFSTFSLPASRGVQ